VRQSPQDRAQYYRQLRATVASVFLPELTSATAVDAAALVDRILAGFIVEEEWADALSNEYGAEFAALLDQGAELASVTPGQFGELRRRAADLVAETSASTDPAARRLCRELVDVERRFLERVDELRRVTMAERAEADAAGSALECSVTAEQLTSYLRNKFPASPELTVTAVEAVPGGRSKETILVSLSGTTDLPPGVIVRKDRPVGLLPTKAADEFAVLSAVYDHGGVPVPRPLFADEVKNGLGDVDGDGTLLVMERVTGGKAGEYFPDLVAPTAHRRALGDQLAAALGRLHSLPLDALGETTLDIVAAVTPESVEAAVEGMAGRIGELSGPPIAAVPLARQWLLDHVADVAPADRLCLLWGDVGLHNMLVDGDRITALVDWEAATVGPPARELAAVWPAATTLMEWGEFVDAYRAAGGPAEAVDPRAIAFYRVFFSLGACMTSRTGGHLFRTGAKRDLLTAHSGLDSHFRAQRNLVHALWDAQADE
jgi:aminoglycoside phosphotransferase (APT) family kinase protein